MIDSSVEDILLTWHEALRAFEDSSDGRQRDELIEQIRRLESLYGRRVDSGQVTDEQRNTGQELQDDTRRLLGSNRDGSRVDEPGEWY